MKSHKNFYFWNISIFLSVFLIFTAHILAHDYWFEADKFHTLENSSVSLHLQLGTKLVIEEERQYQLKRTLSFKLFSAENILDLRDKSSDGMIPVSKFNVGKSGTYLVGMERNPTDIVLDSQKFNEYLAEEGLTQIIQQRTKRGEIEKFGYERYSRFIKALIQIGDKKDHTFSRILGYKLEIIPLENPYKKRVNSYLKFKILFNGKPLKNTDVFAYNRPKSEVFIHQMKTNSQGECRLKLDRDGFWLIRLVKMERCQKDCDETDWESYWGSLSFEVKN